ncbi:unnamed protein product [Cuscuta campestris]|uniref:Transposase Tc1-like domain-containing protein n=1 Tax=Cuscuta campestris TaxID=132261 RepID=A0A484LWL2_9ASTE|nr:unnamed protein product [Cuscuta campestris]
MECRFSGRETESEVEVRINSHLVPKVDKFRYLGSVIQADGELDGDVGHRVGVAWAKWRLASGVLCDPKVSPKMKGKFYRSVVRPAMLYGAECWAVKKTHVRRLHAAEMRMLRWMCGKTRLDRISNEVIRRQVGMAPVEDKLQEARLRWFGHVRRRDADAPVEPGVSWKQPPYFRVGARPFPSMDFPLFPFDLNEVPPLSALEHAAFKGVCFPTAPEPAVTSLLFNGHRASNNPDPDAGRLSVASLAHLSASATVHTGQNTSPAEHEENQQQARSKPRFSMELSQETTTFYTLPTEDDPYRTIQSKKFILKIMFVAVVGRPRFGESGETLWDGKVGNFPFTYEEVAKRNCKNRPAGTLKTKPVDVVNRQVMKAMMLTRVISEMKSKWPDPHNKHIIIQQDNAKPHVDPADLEIVQVCQENGWDIRLQF